MKRIAISLISLSVLLFALGATPAYSTEKNAGKACATAAATAHQHCAKAGCDKTEPGSRCLEACACCDGGECVCTDGTCACCKDGKCTPKKCSTACCGKPKK